jgi:hypothetical protein
MSNTNIRSKLLLSVAGVIVFALLAGASSSKTPAEEKADLLKYKGWTSDQYDTIMRDFGSVSDYDDAQKKGMNATAYRSYKSQISACRDDWQKCTDNEQLVNNYRDYTDAKVSCKMRANDMARYGTPEWPWGIFGTFYSGSDYVKTGKVRLVEDDAKFSNGFGAMVRSRVNCLYDLRSKSVIDVSINAR